MISPAQVISLELFVGDICNLKCLTCFPELSTTLRKEYQALGWAVKKRCENFKEYEVLAQLTSLEKVKFVGGEPLLHKNHIKILEMLNQGERSSKVSLTYYTNATLWPSDEILSLWKKFKNVNIWLSIDGFGALNEYIRFPSVWRDVENNTKKYKRLSQKNSHIQLAVHSTVSIYNIFSLNKLEQWARQLDLEVHFHPLYQPHFLSIQTLPPLYRNLAKEQLNPSSKGQSFIRDYLDQKSLWFDHQMIEFTTHTDRIRGVNIKDYVPELSELFT